MLMSRCAAFARWALRAALRRQLHRRRVHALHELQRAGAHARGLAQHDARGGRGERVNVAVQGGVHQEARGCGGGAGAGGGGRGGAGAGL